MAESLDSEIARRVVDAGWCLRGLGAPGALPRWSKRLRLFGQFVGDWEILPPEREWKDGRPPDATGEAPFEWILGGTAVQDVWGPLDPRTGRLVPQGTTIRFYDPRRRAWRSTGLTPYGRRVQRFVGHRTGREIVLREEDRGWRGEHWVFFEIRRDSFRWRAERRSSPHGHWKAIEEYHLRRAHRTRRARR